MKKVLKALMVLGIALVISTQAKAGEARSVEADGPWFVGAVADPGFLPSVDPVYETDGSGHIVQGLGEIL